MAQAQMRYLSGWWDSEPPEEEYTYTKRGHFNEDSHGGASVWLIGETVPPIEGPGFLWVMPYSERRYAYVFYPYTPIGDQKEPLFDMLRERRLLEGCIVTWLPAMGYVIEVDNPFPGWDKDEYGGEARGLWEGFEGDDYEGTLSLIDTTVTKAHTPGDNLVSIVRRIRAQELERYNAVANMFRTDG